MANASCSGYDPSGSWVRIPHSLFQFEFSLLLISNIVVFSGAISVKTSIKTSIQIPASANACTNMWQYPQRWMVDSRNEVSQDFAITLCSLLSNMVQDCV